MDTPPAGTAVDEGLDRCHRHLVEGIGSRMGLSDARLMPPVGSRRRLPIGTSVALGVLCLMVILAVVAPWVSPFDPLKASISDRMLPPAWFSDGSTEHLLGTDGLGRDVLSRLLFGARISLSVAALAILVGGGIGASVGIFAAYRGGRVDALLMRIVDIMMSIPFILVAIVLAVALGQSFTNIVLIIAVLLWPNMARQIRGDALAVMQQEYAQYAVAIGVPARRIMFRHVLPNVTPSLVVVATLETGAIILTEATLSFLGAGIPPPQPSWGVMVEEGSGLIVTGWWIALFPGLAIMITVLIFNTVGDWLRDRLDPRLLQR